LHTSQSSIYENGKVNGILGIVRDVTERKKAEEKLKESEEKYRKLFESAQDGILIINTETGRITDANPFIEKLLGYNKNEFVGKQIFEISPFKDIVPNKNKFKELQRKKYVRYSHLPLETKKGKKISVEFISNVYPIDHSLVIQANIRDITEQKKAEEKLKQYQNTLENTIKKRTQELSNKLIELKVSQKKYQTLFISSQDALMTLAPPTWKFTAGNPATVKMFNCKDEKQFISLGPWQVSPKKQPDGQLSSVKAKKMIEKAMKEGSNFFEWTHKRYKGEDFPVTVLLNRILINGDTFLQATVRDITEQKLNESQIQEQIEELKELDQLKTQFLSFVSHELRTPLTPIRSQLQRLLGKKCKPQEQQGSLQMILRNTVRLDKLINDVLEISRLESKRMQIFKRSVNLKNLIKNTITTMQPLAEDKNVKISTLFKRVPPTISLDEDRIKQVLINLIDNAIKHSKTKEIAISAKRTNHHVTICVEDQGKGISEKERKHLFELFYVGKESKYLTKGAGLGLPISKGIVNLHGGKIWIKTKIKKGTTFCFTLPIKNSGQTNKQK
jgi:PAS domain S-box-containing protein